MQYSQYYPQIIEDLKMNETQSLFQPKEGTLISKLNDKEQLKELIVIFSHKKREFVSKEIIFGFNSVIISNQYVELSRCYFEMRYTKIRTSDGFYIISIHQGNAKEFMIASNQTQFMRMQIFLKRFCINKNFAGKFQLIDQNGCLPQAQSYKNSEQYCVLMWDKRKVKDERDQETFHNNITIMHALQVSPNLVKVYEDNTKFYLVCQNMKLQSLETLLLNGFEFKEVPLVSIIFIIFQTLQKYKAKGIYHGNISLQSVFINISSPVLQVAVLFPKYLAASDFTIDNDLYSVGVLLYKITFHNQKTKYTQFVDLNLIDHKKQQMHDPNYKETQYKFLYRISQLDLLTQLLLPGATLEQVLRHQWFVTIKQNLKMEQTKTVHRQSLNTIVESVNELSMTSSQDRMYYIPQQQNDDGNTLQQSFQEIEEEFPIKCQIHNPFSMVPSKMKHDLILQYTQKSKTFSNFEHKSEEIMSLSKQPSAL